MAAERERSSRGEVTVSSTCPIAHTAEFTRAHEPGPLPAASAPAAASPWRAPPPPADALEAEAVLRAIGDRLELQCDANTRARHKVWMPTYKAAGLGLELFADPELLPVALWLALVRPHASSVPSDNPLWLATCRATSTTPLSGGVGEAASAGLELKSTGPVETVYA